MFDLCTGTKNREYYSGTDSEISNSDDATNRHKFTYRYARDCQPLILPTIPQVFSEEYQSPFQ
ncbi:MAG: hypothetical protein IKT00_13070 [Prevotella sp.]|nr:hypothetical protein [Prevotella sp.]